jgi:serine/threonine-protein kinase
MGELLASAGAGTVIDGRYELLAGVGRGGMARVWRATDQRLGRDVAVKLLAADSLDERARQRFDLEARTAAALSHPNIVAVHDVGVTAAGVPYLVMELAEGDTLAEVIGRGPLSWVDIVAVSVQVCDALRAAHAAGVVHRDVKPGNIVLTADGVVKVCDFGIAAFARGDDPVIEAGRVLGTAQFMAPEQAHGDSVDHRADLYALGCVIYAMATGHPPFTGNNSASVAWRHVHQPVIPLRVRRRGTPPALDTIVGRLLAKDPSDRPASAAEVKASLESVAVPTEESTLWLGRAAAATRPPTRPLTQVTIPIPVSAFQRHRALASVGAVCVVVLTAILIAAAVRGQDGAVTDAPASAPAASSALAAPPSRSAVLTQPVRNPAAALAALEAAIRAQAGSMNEDAIKALMEKTRAIGESLARGNEAKAASKLRDLQKKLAQLRKEGGITAAGFDALQPPLAHLGAALPVSRDDDDD